MSINDGRSPQIMQERPKEPVIRPLPKMIEVSSIAVLETAEAPQKQVAVEIAPPPAPPAKSLTLHQIDRIYRSAHPFKKKPKKKKRKK